METMHPALKNGRNVWDRVNMPESEFQARVERVRAQMKKSAIDLLLLYGRGLTEYADPCYVSNFVIRLPRGTIALVPLDGPLVLFFEQGIAIIARYHLRHGIESGGQCREGVRKVPEGKGSCLKHRGAGQV